MTERMHELVGEIVRLHSELDREIEARRKRLGLEVSAGIVSFEQGVLAEQRRLRMRVSRFIAQASLGTLLTAPLIYSLIVPLVLLDLWISLYQSVCFRIYGIDRVRRADYIVFDRQHLGYLNWIEALNCCFCAYGNGLIAYVREISGRTEQYWCPIKHALKIHDPHRHYFEFLEYGDADGYRARLEAFARSCKRRRTERTGAVPGRLKPSFSRGMGKRMSDFGGTVSQGEYFPVLPGVSMPS